MSIWRDAKLVRSSLSDYAVDEWPHCCHEQELFLNTLVVCAESVKMVSIHVSIDEKLCTQR